MPGDRARRTGWAGPGGRRPTVSTGPARIRAETPGGTLRAPWSQEGGGRPRVFDLSRRIRSRLEHPGGHGGDPCRGNPDRLGTLRQDPMVEAKPALVDPHRLSVVRRPFALGNVRGRAGECTA